MIFSEVLKNINDFVWGPVMLILLVGTGVFLMIRLKFRPLRNLGYALCQVFSKHSMKKSDNTDAGDISPFQSLMTALAATIGTGNIVGVATAMTLGGPGALFWMWISAIFGLATKYGESVLAVFYREKNSKGEMSGGPMFSIKNGFKVRWLGTILSIAFAVFAVIASFGIGNLTQINSISEAVLNTFSIPTWITGIVIAVLVGIVLLGGIKSIGNVSSKIVPFMAVFYAVGCLIIIIANVGNLPTGLGQIMESAFSSRSILGGVAGFTFATALRFGVARGVFSNEAGLGSAPIAAAAAKTDHPCRQGYINMTGTFFDTIIVCTLTGLAIACSGVLGTLAADGSLVTGASLTILAFDSTLGSLGSVIVTIGLILFAFSTILGWSYYGEKSLEFLIPSMKAKYIYRALFACAVFVGAITTLEIVWDFSDTANGLMAIPNLICLLVLSGVIVSQTKDFDDKFLQYEKRSRKKT
ncbi:alanine/glycine:cation symporter family protein [Christensenella sp.]|uniref:alanine/glycine:cation symporter family protein n=1 Tax=Christensenella sp. TaxID=1935934 RepID=UPI003FA45177